jgi:hypothetical protein
MYLDLDIAWIHDAHVEYRIVPPSISDEDEDEGLEGYIVIRDNSFRREPLEREIHLCLKLEFWIWLKVLILDS